MRYSTDVLVFGTMGNIGSEVQRLLASHGLQVAAVPFQQNVFCDEPGYRRTLVSAIADCRPEIVFPIRNPLAMARFKGLLEQGVPLSTVLNRRKMGTQWEEAVRSVRIAVESEEKVRLLDSKVRCHALARELGIMQPAVYDKPEDVPEGMKVVFKRDVSFGGHGVHLPKSIEALNNLIVHQSPGEPFLIEEFIEGKDYSLDVVRWRDCIVSGGYECLPAKDCRPARLSPKCFGPVDGYMSQSKNDTEGNFGPAGCRIVLHERDKVLEKMRACAKTILEHLDYHGVCGFDFRADTSGMVWLLECNPRFTGGVATQAAAGLDIPWELYRLMKENDIVPACHGLS